MQEFYCHSLSSIHLWTCCSCAWINWVRSTCSRNLVYSAGWIGEGHLQRDWRWLQCCQVDWSNTYLHTGKSEEEKHPLAKRKSVAPCPHLRGWKPQDHSLTFFSFVIHPLKKEEAFWYLSHLTVIGMMHRKHAQCDLWGGMSENGIFWQYRVSNTHMASWQNITWGSRNEGEERTHTGFPWCKWQAVWTHISHSTKPVPKWHPTWTCKGWWRGNAESVHRKPYCF